MRIDSRTPNASNLKTYTVFLWSRYQIPLTRSNKKPGKKKNCIYFVYNRSGVSCVCVCVLDKNIFLEWYLCAYILCLLLLHSVWGACMRLPVVDWTQNIPQDWSDWRIRETYSVRIKRYMCIALHGAVHTQKEGAGCPCISCNGINIQRQFTYIRRKKNNTPHTQRVEAKNTNTNSN